MAEYSRPWDRIGVGDGLAYDHDDWWELYRTIHINSEEWDERGPIAGMLEELQVVPTSPATMNVVVEPGGALVYGGWYLNDADLTLPIAANPGPGVRYDFVVLRASWAAQTIRAVIVQGTPGAGAPALTQIAGTTWEIPLALVEVAVLAASITAPDITDHRQFPNPRQKFLGIGDFETDLSVNTATISNIGAIFLKGWLLSGSTDEGIYATIIVPPEWGDSALACRLRIWGYCGAADANVVRIYYRAYTSGDAPANLILAGAFAHMTPAVILRTLENVLDLATFNVTPGQILEILLEHPNTSPNDYWVLGFEVDFRRD